MFSISCSSIGLALLIFIVVMCAISEAAQYRAKFVIFTLFCAFAASWSIPIMLFRPGDWRNALLPAWQLQKFAKLLGFNFIIRGHENIVKDTGAIVVINHQSAMDLIVLAELWPTLERCTVVSKKIILYLGTFGLASWLWGTIFIDRGNVQDAQQRINSTAEIINKRKAKLLLFPEGTRHSSNTLKPFKKGAFHVAIASQTPIQPVVVSKYYFMDHKLLKFNHGTSFITILPPIPTIGMTKDDLPNLLDKTYQLMNEEFQRTSQEVLSKYGNNTKCE
ncbi:hypothetical protein PV328_005295 [Microctonus aethiopoides]|uniref:1-acyl-sn-glycerol-3-phosphate acyltransferase n=1 Tax=Microctonus aethiopoides TaxID=144406 RepID=A0AA39FM39_9HYME|nr:hypothetical protein PV328_005295 [Microctonus aethiopoides]